MDHVLVSVAGLARVLRANGVNASQERVLAMVSGLAILDVTSAQDVYWAGRTTLCSSPADIAQYDRAFLTWFGGHQLALRGQSETVEVNKDVALPVPDDPAVGLRDTHSLAATSSTREVLRNRDVARLTQQERDEVDQMIASLYARSPHRLSARRSPGRGNLIDRPRSIRAILENAGEPSGLATQRRKLRARKVIFLIDVSGSMSPYADSLLRLAHACVRGMPGTEVFTLGTRLTRVTRELNVRGVNAAMSAVTQVIPDWSGGTRLGLELKEFLDRYGHAGKARGALVVIASDGWERGDATLLASQTARLKRLAHELIWLNPHVARPGFEPITLGMAAALPFVDALVEGHSVSAFEQLVTRLSKDRHRRV